MASGRDGVAPDRIRLHRVGLNDFSGVAGGGRSVGGSRVLGGGSIGSLVPGASHGVGLRHHRFFLSARILLRTRWPGRRHEPHRAAPRVHGKYGADHRPVGEHADVGRQLGGTREAVIPHKLAGAKVVFHHGEADFPGTRFVLEVEDHAVAVRRPPVLDP